MGSTRRFIDVSEQVDRYINLVGMSRGVGINSFWRSTLIRSMNRCMDVIEQFDLECMSVLDYLYNMNDNIAGNRGIENFIVFLNKLIQYYNKSTSRRDSETFKRLVNLYFKTSGHREIEARKILFGVIEHEIRSIDKAYELMIKGGNFRFNLTDTFSGFGIPNAWRY